MSDKPTSNNRLSWPAVLPVHPATDLFPMMSRDELRELAADIKANGLKIPIIVWLRVKIEQYLASLKPGAAP